MTNSLSNHQPKDNKEDGESLEDEVIEAVDEEVESVAIEGDPEEPGKKETFGPAPNDPEIDRIIGRGLKPPPVHNDGLW